MSGVVCDLALEFRILLGLDGQEVRIHPLILFVGRRICIPPVVDLSAVRGVAVGLATHIVPDVGLDAHHVGAQVRLIQAVVLVDIGHEPFDVVQNLI